jgi:hypothetical protein
VDEIHRIKAETFRGRRLSGLGRRLRPGQRFTAKVLDVGKDGLARLDLGRFSVTAALGVPVKRGMQLPLEVVSSAGHILLKVRDAKRRKVQHRPSPPGNDKHVPSVQAHRSAPGRAGRLETDPLVRLPPERPSAPGDKPGHASIPHEKPAENPGTTMGGGLPPAAHTDPSPEGVYGRPRERGGENGSHHVVISLSLSHFGDTRADVRLTPCGLDITLRISEPSARALVTKHKGELQAALAPLAPSVSVDALPHGSEMLTSEGPPGVVRIRTERGVNVDA